jgi:putative peptidoglycan lipid II flippase
MSQASQVFGQRTTPSSELANEHAQPRGAGMARNAIIVSVAFVLSRLLGLAREMILARQFGTGPEMEAYVAAFRIPDLLFLTIMSGAFGAAFIPVFGGFIDRGDRERASRLASSILTWTGISVLITGAIAYVLAGAITSALFDFDAYTHDLTVELMRILLLSPVFLGLGIAFKGILEAQNQFTLPALSPLVYNAAIIVGAAFFAPEYGIHAVAWAVIIGAILHMAIELPGVARSGLAFWPTLDRRVDGLSEVLRLLGPRVLGQAAFQINFIAVTAFASTIGDENVAAFNYAWQLLMLPHGVLALSISTVAFPSLAALFSRGDRRGFGRLLDRTMRPLLFLSIPASVGLLLAGRPIVMVIFEGGNFTERSTDLVVAALTWFAIGLVGYGLTEIVTRVFYAMRDTRTPVITGVLTIILNIILCSLLIGSLGIEGLSISLSATTAAEAVIMLFFLRYRSGQVFSPGFFGWLMKVIFATAAMGVVMRISSPWLLDVLEADISFVTHAVYLGLCMVAYVSTFVVAAWFMRIPELEQSVDKIAARLPANVRAILFR